MGERAGLTPRASLHGGSIPSVLLFFWCAVLLTSSGLASRGFTTEYLSTLIYPVLYCCTTYIYLACIYTCRVLLPLLLPLCTGVAAAAAAVRHRLLDGKICCWFIESYSIQCFLSLHSNAIYLHCTYSLAVLSNLRPGLAYTTSSVITGMRGAKAAVSPPRRSRPCNTIRVGPAKKRIKLPKVEARQTLQIRT